MVTGAATANRTTIVASSIYNVGGSLDHMDVIELISNIQKPWDGTEAPTAHFARGDKYERQLLKAGQRKNPEF